MNRRLLKEFCVEYKRRFKCPKTECTVCPYLMSIYAFYQHHKTGCTMNYAIKNFVKKPIERELAKKILEEAIGIPLPIARALLRKNDE